MYMSPFQVNFSEASHWPLYHMISSRPLIGNPSPPKKNKISLKKTLVPAIVAAAKQKAGGVLLNSSLAAAKKKKRRGVEGEGA